MKAVMKKRMVCGVFVIFFMCTSVYSIKNDSFEDYDFDELDIYANMLEEHEGLRADGCIDAQGVLDLIADPATIDAQSKLQQNLYLHTYNVNQRSLLDMPQFLIHEYCLPQRWQINSWFFYNETTRANFTDEGTNITAYWDLENANFIQNLDQLDLGVDIPTAIELFGLLKMQERRGGFMFGVAHANGRFNLEFKTPLYYLERNFFVTPAEEKLLEEFFGPSDPEQQKHFISDRIGFGDTRLTLGCFAVEHDRLKLNVGVEATIPTQISFHKGLLGSDFPKNSNHPIFNLLELFQLVFCEVNDPMQIEAISVNFLLSAFDKLSANLLQTSLGNNGHLGLMIFAEKFLHINDRFRVTTRSALEYLCPALDTRFYITKKFRQEFNAFEPYTTADGAIADQAPVKLAFLNEQLINTLIPKVYQTMIYPGFIFKFTTCIDSVLGKRKRWKLGVGFDLWWQDRERLGKIYATPWQISQIRTDIAVKPGAYQNKLFISSNYNGRGENFDWCLTLYGDGTFLSSGIGKDFNLSLRFAAEI